MMRDCRLPAPPLRRPAPGILCLATNASRSRSPPKLGAAPMIGLIVGGQMLTSLFLDHFGLVGYPASPVTIWKILGILGKK